MSTESSASCIEFNFTKAIENDVFNYMFLGEPILALLSCLSAILLVVATKTYKEFVYRLILYLAFAAFTYSLFFSLQTLLYVFVKLKTGWAPIHVPILFVTGYSLLLFGLIVCWIAVYVFALAVCGIQLKKTRHEVIGVVMVLVFPLTLVWTIPVYYTTGCYFNYRGLLITICGLMLPFSLSTLVATVTTVFVILSLCKCGLWGRSAAGSTRSKALIELIPFIGFFILQNLFASMEILYYALLAAEKTPPFTIAIIINLFYPFGFISIPLLLLCQPKIRHELRCFAFGQRHREIRRSASPECVSHGSSLNHQEVHQQTSQTHYVVSQESSLSEQDPLIIKQ